MLPLGSPSFSILLLKAKDLAEEFGSGTMYDNVAPHAWSPPNFPHSDKEAKANGLATRVVITLPRSHRSKRHHKNRHKTGRLLFVGLTGRAVLFCSPP